MQVATTSEDRARLWQARISALGRLYPSYYLQTVWCPAAPCPRCWPGLRTRGEHELPVANVFHAGDGNLHP